MTENFTTDHFKLLNKWKGQRRDESNPEQNRAYEELKKAYLATEAWADRVRAELFPFGRVEIRKRPTNQGNNFASYNWAKIYPSPEAPVELAFTVGIDADAGFVVKIDTVGLDESNATRRAYLALRGPYSNSAPFVALLPASDGLAKSLDQLVAWSTDAIRGFRMRYDDVVEKLGVGKSLTDEDLLKHFDGKPAFKTSRAGWTPEEKARFCRLARAIHAAGLDWWHATKNVQIRFGRKSPGSERAAGVLGIVRGTRVRKISWNKVVGDLPELHREELTDALVSRIEAVLTSERDTIRAWLPLEAERPGLWPDELRDDPLDTGDEADDEHTSDPKVSRPSINRIYYGPPGTGKTYEISRLLKREYEQSMVSVPSDQWKQEFIAEKIAVLKWWEAAAAALYDLGGRGKVGDLIKHPFVQALAATTQNKSVHQTLWQSLSSHAVEDSKTVKQANRSSPAVFDKQPDSTWQLDGDWKEACADITRVVDELRAGPRAPGAIQRYSFVTFHQSYGYEEFVEGLRPVLEHDGETGDIKYEVRSGVFKELCRRARSAPDQRFAMVIDEINRGNISKIFGELITLIEPDKREGAENAVSVTLPYSLEGFSVPANVDLIGTMNTADRSLALLDTALRRRFEFVAVMPDSRDDAGAPLGGLRVVLADRTIHVPRMLEAMNQRIEALYDRDHCIGHAYFTPLKSVRDGEERLLALQQVFSTRILPLLEEYFFEDWQKICLVLADNQKPDAARFVLESVDHDAGLDRLFGSDHGLDTFSAKRRFAVQPAAFSNPDAYIGIYDPPATAG